MDLKQTEKYRKYLERLRIDPHNSIYAHKVRKYAPLTGGTCNTHKLIEKINNMLLNVSQKGGDVTQEMHEQNMLEVAKFNEASKKLSDNKSEAETKLTQEIDELKKIYTEQLDEKDKVINDLEKYYKAYQAEVKKVINAFDEPENKNKDDDETHDETRDAKE